MNHHFFPSPVSALCRLALMGALLGGAVPTAHASAAYFAIAAAYFEVLTPLNPDQISLTVTDGSSSAFSDVRVHHFKQGRSHASSESIIGAQSIETIVIVEGDASALGSYEAYAASKGASNGLTLTLTNLTDEAIFYDWTAAFFTMTNATSENGGELVDASAFADYLFNGAPFEEYQALGPRGVHSWSLHVSAEGFAFSPAQTPEPGSLALLTALGVMGAGLLARRRIGR